MKQHIQIRRLVAITLFCAGWFILPGTARAQSTAFTYQGHLNDGGAPASGAYNLDFTLKDAPAGGSTVANTTTQSLSNVPVVNGVFTVQLNFGASAYAGGNRWLEIRVDGSTLSPRHPLSPSPMALALPNVWCSSGKVGIGSTPSNALDVASGSIRVAGTAENTEIQGLHLLWNKNNGDGSAWFVNSKGGGGGGFHFAEATGPNAYLERMTIDPNGRVGIGTTSPDALLTVAGDIKCTAVYLTSDREKKDGFEPVNAREVLDKVADMPITSWHYKSDTGVPHIGPMAQDFHDAFGLGQDDKHIATVDADGVALAAIQGLKEVVDEKDKRILELEQRLQRLEQLVGANEAGH